MSMFGGNSYSNRSYIGGATSRLWAGTTFQKVVGVDLNRATFVDTLNLPESYASEAEIGAIAVNGPLIAAVVADGAVMWDRRAMPRRASCRDVCVAVCAHRGRVGAIELHRFGGFRALDVESRRPRGEHV